MRAREPSSEPRAGGSQRDYVHVAGRLVGKKYGRGYRVYSEEGQLRFTAEGLRGSQPLQVCFSGGSSLPEVTLKMRTSFTLTGRIDVMDTTSSASMGSVTRSRKFFDAGDRLLGRLDDAKTWREHIGESFVDAVGQIFFGGGGEGQPSPPDRFVLSVEKRVVGSLVRVRLPFFPDPPRRPRFPRIERLLQRGLPRKVGDALFTRTPPGGWRLEVSDRDAIGDWRLAWCAVLMTIELSHW